MTKTISRAQLGNLETIAWGEQHFGSLVTNRQFPRRDMMRLVAAGLASSIGFVEMCDADGAFVEPSRVREGFVLTDAGRAELAKLDEKYPSSILYSPTPGAGA